MYSRKYNKIRKNKQVSRWSSYPRRIQKSAIQIDNDRQYYKSLNEKYKKYGFLTYQEQVWLENNAHRFDY